MPLPASGLTANYLGAQNGSFEPQRMNNGLFRIFGVPGDSGDLLVLSLDSFPVPKQDNNVLEAFFLNQKRRFSGTADPQEMSVVYKDFCDKNTAKILMGWRHVVYDPKTGVINLARNYKRTGMVEIFAPNGTLFRQYDLIGVWPSAMDPGDIDMTSDDMIKLTVTFQVDNIIQTFAY